MTDPLVRSVDRLIPVRPEVVFALLANPARHPAIDGSQTVRSVRTSDGDLALGSSFTMNMRRGFSYSTKSTVIAFERNRVIAWQTRPVTFPLPLLVGGRIWRYELIDSGTGTLVRETWDIRGERNRRFVRRLGEDTERQMAESLERIEQLTAQP